MRFVDRAEIFIKAGDGGDGCVSFVQGRNVRASKPTGGNGGGGGDIILAGDRQCSTLLDFRYRRIFKAKRGARGGPNTRKGNAAAPLILRLPLGTEVIEKQSGSLIWEAMEDGQQCVICKGGPGGRGSASFPSQAPADRQPLDKGLSGEQLDVILQLKLIADIGLVGPPNAGKSTLLACLTQAKPKIGNFQFTTVKPNLGVLETPESSPEKSLVIADLPGIIKDASQGKGLGIRFLGHAERCRSLVICLPADAPDIVESSSELISDLEAYGLQLSHKSLTLVLTKADLVTPDQAENQLTAAQDFLTSKDLKPSKSLAVSSLHSIGIRQLKQRLIDITQQKHQRSKLWSPLGSC